MVNQLKMADRNSILALHRGGWSFRRISQHLGIHRDTVSRCVRRSRGAGTAADTTPAAADLPGPSKPAAEGIRDYTPGESKQATQVFTGNRAAKSRCEPHREVILEKLNQGLSAQRIHQDLASEHQFAGSYQSVRRFVYKLSQGRPLPFRRMECEPGQECQVDFGKGALIEQEGRRKRPHLFRMILGYSRKGYSEVVWRQTTENFLRCLENAFHYFGGVPKVTVIDNLRAGVTRADWYDPELNPKLQSFAEHYGTTILPTKPRMPRHKGKIERGVGYAQNNALKGRSFTNLQEENLFLQEWEANVADLRIHGTTRKQVRKRFDEEERPALLPLPPDRFPCFHEGRRSVHRDAHVEVDKAYYSVPPEYMGRKVWVRFDTRTVRIFNDRMAQVALHLKHEPGRFSTDHAHITSEKISAVEQGAEALLKRTRWIGPHTARWAEEMLKKRGIQGIRVLVGLLSLAGKYSGSGIERACRQALDQRAFRLRVVRGLVKHGDHQQRFEFADEHPIIRPMSQYGWVDTVSFDKGSP